MTRAPALGELHGRLRTIAVTGTNGKTTTTSMIAAIVAASGEVEARVTTVGAWVAGEEIAYDGSMGAFTRVVQRAVDAGVETLALEVTSRALGKARFASTWAPDVAVFTNLTRDHLDYHGSAEEYLAAKAQLFVALPPSGGVAVLNLADPCSGLIAEVTPEGARRAGFVGVRGIAEGNEGIPIALQATGVEATRDGTAIALAPGEEPLRLGVLGEVHAENALAAAVACEAAGYSRAAIGEGLARFRGVAGRFEVVSRRPLVVVDYAHTPDGLEGTLRTARALVAADRGRVIVVFGCGGDRDRGKRPQMGRIADTRADVVVLTNDNPRSEEPGAIADEVAAGATGKARWVRELDRARAIAIGIAEAQPADVVVIAGKGHESTQTIGDRVIPFSDVDVARAALEVAR